jgi:hypothetical protein
MNKRLPDSVYANPPGSLQRAAARGVETPRVPTPEYEYGFLGLGNSRYRILDPQTMTGGTLADMFTGSLGFIPQLGFPNAIVQETVKLYGGPFRPLAWERKPR